MRLLRDNNLTLVLLLLFAGSIGGQWLTGWHVALEDAARHGEPGVGLAAYTLSPEFLSSVFENWESEFLQMSAYVVLTAMLIQRGSSRSRDPDSPPRDADLAAQALKPGAPAMLSKGRLARALYARSLGIILFLLFLLSFVTHWTQSARAAAEEARNMARPRFRRSPILATRSSGSNPSRTGRAEFLSTAVLVVLSIFLRQRESPESKAVAAPHSQTGIEQGGTIGPRKRHSPVGSAAGNHHLSNDRSRFDPVPHFHMHALATARARR